MADSTSPNDADLMPVDLAAGDGDAVSAFMLDMEVPGAVAEVDPEDAERAGAFEEHALSAEDALQARFDVREAA
ncbi:hypothetical protein FBY14_12437 [Azospirillum brasilense]|nr:hypothetical protein FBY14_12437 [Azospirillum brasilense]